VTLGAMVLAPAAARAQSESPLIIADGGSSVGLPARGLASYQLAVSHGADLLWVELGVTSEGTLIARPGRELGATTDVVRRPEFAARHKTKSIEGGPVTGWFAEDFTLAELKSLGGLDVAVDRSRSQRAEVPGFILTVQEVIDVARAGSIRAGRVVGVYADMANPSYFASIDLPLEPRLAATIRANGYNSPAAALFVSASEVGALETLAKLTQARRVQRLEALGGPYDTSGVTYAEMTQARGLAGVRAYSSAIAPAAEMLLAGSGGAFPRAAAPLVVAAHATGLAVHANLADDRGEDRRMLETLFLAGVDGVICRRPSDAVTARKEAMRRVRGDRWF